MPVIAWLIVLLLAVVSLSGMVVFLAQFRTHKPKAMLALAVAMFATLTLCALTFLGGAYQINSIGN